MRTATLLALTLVGGMIARPAQAPAQINIGIRFGSRLGPEISLFAYSPVRYGNWRTNYRRWRPVTLYEMNGHYYRYRINGARAVEAYTYRNEYFMPPRDEAWINRDRRFDYRRRPSNDDYDRARSYSADLVSVDPAHEIGVMAYSTERGGEWRQNYRRWRPVTVYELRGHYYTKRVAGSRPVAMYRYRQEYFMPPHDQDWVGADRRFDYAHLPNTRDRGRARVRP